MRAGPLDRSPREEVKVGVAGFWGQAGSPSLKQLVVRCHIKDSARPLGKAPFHISRRVKHRNSPMGGGETGGAQTLPPGHSQAFWVPEGSPETGCGSRSTCRATHDGTVPPGSLSSSPEARPRPRPVLWGEGGGRASPGWGQHGTGCHLRVSQGRGCGPCTRQQQDHPLGWPVLVSTPETP